MDKLIEQICQLSMCSPLRNIRELSSNPPLNQARSALRRSSRVTTASSGRQKERNCRRSLKRCCWKEKSSGSNSIPTQNIHPDCEGERQREESDRGARDQAGRLPRRLQHIPSSPHSPLALLTPPTRLHHLPASQHRHQPHLHQPQRGRKDSNPSQLLPRTRWHRIGSVIIIHL